jgi:hypothetical protein
MNLGIVQQEWVGGLSNLKGDCSSIVCSFVRCHNESNCVICTLQSKSLTVETCSLELSPLFAVCVVCLSAMSSASTLIRLASFGLGCATKLLPSLVRSLQAFRYVVRAESWLAPTLPFCPRSTI